MFIHLKHKTKRKPIKFSEQRSDMISLSLLQDKSCSMKCVTRLAIYDRPFFRYICTHVDECGFNFQVEYCVEGANAYCLKNGNLMEKDFSYVHFHLFCGKPSYSYSNTETSKHVINSVKKIIISHIDTLLKRS